MDAAGRDLSTGRLPARAGGWLSPATALAAAPVVDWPVSVVGDEGVRLTLAQALGPGGRRVEALLDALADVDPISVDGLDVEALARATPAGMVSMPLAIVTVARGVEAAERVDPGWLVEVDDRRAAPRRALVAAGRGEELEAALHVTSLVATERLDPADDDDVDAHVASGARLWLLTGAVVSALAGDDRPGADQPGSFEAWATLVVAGWWPVGPSGRHLVVSGAGARRRG